MSCANYSVCQYRFLFYIVYFFGNFLIGPSTYTKLVVCCLLPLVITLSAVPGPATPLNVIVTSVSQSPLLGAQTRIAAMEALGAQTSAYF
jgi:hypothetical protein